MGEPKSSKSSQGAGQKSFNSVRDDNTRNRKQTKASLRSVVLVLPKKLSIYTVPPPSWPTNLPYLHTSLAHPNLNPSQHAIWHRPDLPVSPVPLYCIPTLVTYTPTSNPFIQIRCITDSKHPAYQQHGLFAAKYLPLGTHIVDYTGSLHSCSVPSAPVSTTTTSEAGPNSTTPAQSPCATSDYDLAFLDRDASLGIDGSTMGNEARFVNDWRGIRENGPNAMFEEYYVRVRIRGRECWEGRMGIWVLPMPGGGGKGKGKYGGGSGGGIEKGEEICVSYGKGWWRARIGMMESCEEEGEERVSDCQEEVDGGCWEKKAG